jgi:hypothetical protein
LGYTYFNIPKLTIAEINSLVEEFNKREKKKEKESKKAQRKARLNKFRRPRK